MESNTGTANENGRIEVEDEREPVNGLNELQRRVSELEQENSRLRDQMLQANLHELMQRRKNDALQDEIERLQARLTQPTDGDSESESHD